MAPTVSNPLLKEKQNSSGHERSHVHGTKFEEAGLYSRSAILLQYPLFFFLPAVLEVKLNNGHKYKYIITSLLLVITKVLDGLGLRWSHYFEASFVVATVYTTLLEVNMKYTRVAIIPIIMVIFMAALYRRDNIKCGSNVSGSSSSSSGVPVVGCSSIGIDGELGEDKVRGRKKKKRDSGRSSGVAAGCSRSIGTTPNNNLGLGIGEDKARGKKPVEIQQEVVEEFEEKKHDISPLLHGRRPPPQLVGGEANTPPPNSYGGGGSKKDKVLVAITVLPYWVLCYMCMGNLLDGENLVVSQFLLYLTSTLGVVALMVAKLPTQNVPLALEVVLRRSILILVLLAAHTFAAELQGEDVVLIVMPELVTALLWFSIYIGHGGSSTSSRPATIVHKATSLEAAAATAIIVIIFASSLASANFFFLQGAANLFPRISAGCAISGILLGLSVFALRQWPEGTVAEPSAEFEGAIRLFSLYRNTMFLAAVAFASFKKLDSFTLIDHTSINTLLIRSIHV